MHRVARPERPSERKGGRLAQAGGALANPSIRRVQLAWTGCITAEMAQAVGLAVVAYRLTGLYGVATLGLVRSLPAAVVGPFAAGLVDGRRRERVLLAVLATRAAFMVVAALVVASALPVPIVFVVAAADAIVYSVWWPTQSALLPDLATSANEATSANIATTVVENGGGLVGPLLGAALLRLAEPAAVFGVAAAVLAAAAIVMVPLARHARPRVRTHEARAHGMFAGFRVAFGQRHPRTIVSLYLLQTFTLGMLGVLTVAAAIELLHLGEPGVGLLNSAIGAGGLLGAAASVALVGRRHLGTALGVALVGWGTAVAIAGAAPIVPIVIVLLACVGVGNAFVDVSALTLLQRTVDDSVLVRVLAVFEGLWWAMLGLGALAAAAVIDVAGIRHALVITGAVLALAAIASARELRRIDAVAGPPAHVLARLQSVSFLEPLPPAALERLAFAAATVHARAGDTLVRAGERGDLFYVVDDGEVEVHATDGDVVLSANSEGFFGELALLNDAPRTATVTARTDVRILTLAREVFLEALALDPATHEATRHRPATTP